MLILRNLVNPVQRLLKLPEVFPAKAARRTRDRDRNSSTRTTPHHSPNKARALTLHSPDSPRHQYSPSPFPHPQRVYYSIPIASAQPPTPPDRDPHQPATGQTPHHQAA